MHKENKKGRGMGMLQDLFGYFKRNIRNMNDTQKRKMRRELQSIIDLLDKEIKNAA
jgi:hypothetical protein